MSAFGSDREVAGESYHSCALLHMAGYSLICAVDDVDAGGGGCSS